jgi:CDGSH-type Zn-finger protein
MKFGQRNLTLPRRHPPRQPHAGVAERAVEFSCTAARRDGKLLSKARHPGELSAREIAPDGGLLMAEVTIEARPNGPYVVTGTIELHDTNGNILPTQVRTVLCRCGASTRKPFCDGTHSKVGFQAAAQAVPDSVEKT